MFRWWRRLNRAEVVAAEFPEEYRAIVTRHAPLTRYLSDPQRHKLEALMRVFLAEKTFEGARGLEVTDEMQVAISARACLLVLGRTELDDPLFPDLVSIVVYPSAYRAKHVAHEGHVVIEGEQARLGESWTRGTVVLAWDHVQSGGVNPNDGHDVVVHEFAHQLDAEDGAMDGTPELENSAQYRAWADVMGEEYAELLSAIERRRKTDIDPYGATNAPEFFAVATETFFEKPLLLERRHPDLYQELKSYFRLDPAEMIRAGRDKP
jgi:MtfA peptidase